MNSTPNEVLYEMISKFKQLDRADQWKAIGKIENLLENEKYHVKTVPVKVEGTLICHRENHKLCLWKKRAVALKR